MKYIPVDPIHPGIILKEEFLVEHGLSSYKAASDMGIPRTRLERIVKGENGISADTALRLSRYFGNSAEFWLNLQRGYDLSVALNSAKDLDSIKPLAAA